MINTNSTIYNMHDREYAAMQRGAAALMAKQPKPTPARVSRPKSEIPQSGIPYVTWDKSKAKDGMWSVNVIYKGVKKFCGLTFNKYDGPYMQSKKTAELFEEDAAMERARIAKRQTTMEFSYQR